MMDNVRWADFKQVRGAPTEPGLLNPGAALTLPLSWVDWYLSLLLNATRWLERLVGGSVSPTEMEMQGSTLPCSVTARKPRLLPLSWLDWYISLLLNATRWLERLIGGSVRSAYGQLHPFSLSGAC